MHKYKSVLIILFFILFITPNLFRVLSGNEDFPFSNNPMFGHYITNNDQLVTLNFLIETDSGLHVIDYDKYGLWEIRLKRFYFSNFYGSSEPNSPQGNVSPNLDRFKKNNTIFFKRLYEIVSKETSQVKRIYLALDHLSKEGVFVSRRNIGYFDPDSKRFKIL